MARKEGTPQPQPEGYGPELTNKIGEFMVKQKLGRERGISAVKKLDAAVSKEDGAQIFKDLEYVGKLNADALWIGAILVAVDTEGITQDTVLRIWEIKEELSSAHKTDRAEST